MISLGGLVSQKAFGKFEMGKVISNPFATAFIKEGEGEDHEVSMANNSIDTIIKMATELKAKMGENEKQIPAWIQDHISKAENYISQASGNYHEYGNSNESVNETKFNAFFGSKKIDIDAKDLHDAKQKAITQLKVPKSKIGLLAVVSAESQKNQDFKFEIVSEEMRCWDGYRKDGTQIKNGKTVNKCVKENKPIVKEARKITFIQRDYTKILDAIQAELEKYKQNKGTDGAAKNIDNLKKLNNQKNQIESEMHNSVGLMYKDYDFDTDGKFSKR